jgi:hypothetical protein
VPGPGGSSDPTRDAIAEDDIIESQLTRAESWNGWIFDNSGLSEDYVDENSGNDWIFDNSGLSEDYVDDTSGEEFTDTVETTTSRAVEEARNIGPDWLDEVTGVVLVLALIGGALWLARPLLELGVAATDA